MNDTPTNDALAAEQQDCWQDLLDKSDRTSPEEYPDMALITREELFDYMNSAAPLRTQPKDAEPSEAVVEAVARAIHEGRSTIPWDVTSQQDTAYRDARSALASAPQNAPQPEGGEILAGVLHVIDESFRNHEVEWTDEETQIFQTARNSLTRSPAISTDDEAVRLLRDIVQSAYSEYKARDGEMRSIEGEDGEQAMICPHDPFFEARAYLDRKGSAS